VQLHGLVCSRAVDSRSTLTSTVQHFTVVCAAEWSQASSCPSERRVLEGPESSAFGLSQV